MMTTAQAPGSGTQADPYCKIQDGIDAVAQPGTVHVASGTYQEEITLSDKVQVLGAGADTTTIQGDGIFSVDALVTASAVGPSTKLDGFTITNNNSGYSGGIRITNGASPLISNCNFVGNSAVLDGGGMYNSYSSPTVTDCVFSGNSASDGGGMFNYYNFSPTVTNCVFHGNSVGWYGGGMYNSNGCSPDLTNCIVTSNTAGGSYSGGGVYWGDCLLADPDYNDFWDNSPDDYGDCLAGSNDISQDPMFVNLAAHDFHLMSGSPCIDAGTDDGAPAEDMDGNHRPIDGNGDGIATTDMGAYEYVLASVEFSATPTTGPIPLEVQFTDETPGDFSSWIWDFGGGGTSNEQNPTHIYNRTGPFTVSLTISSISGRGTETKVNYIHPYTQGVGGEAYPVNRLAILAPWIALGMAFIAGSFMTLRRRISQG